MRVQNLSDHSLPLACLLENTKNSSKLIDSDIQPELALLACHYFKCPEDSLLDHQS